MHTIYFRSDSREPKSRSREKEAGKQGKSTEEGIIYWPPRPFEKHIKCLSELSAKGTKVRNNSSQAPSTPTSWEMSQGAHTPCSCACMCSLCMHDAQQASEKAESTAEAWSKAQLSPSRLSCEAKGYKISIRNIQAWAKSIQEWKECQTLLAVAS